MSELQPYFYQVQVLRLCLVHYRSTYMLYMMTHWTAGICRNCEPIHAVNHAIIFSFLFFSNQYLSPLFYFHRVLFDTKNDISAAGTKLHVWLEPTWVCFFFVFKNVGKTNFEPCEQSKRLSLLPIMAVFKAVRLCTLIMEHSISVIRHCFCSSVNDSDVSAFLISNSNRLLRCTATIAILRQQYSYYSTVSYLTKAEVWKSGKCAAAAGMLEVSIIDYCPGEMRIKV